MGRPARLDRQSGRWALVDDIPFRMPVYCRNSPALFAIFPIDADKARVLIPGSEIHPLRLWNKGLLAVSVFDYLDTNIGRYVGFSIAIACTHGPRPAPRLLPALFMGHYGAGQWVLDLPVSTEVSVKGGKGIWGMPIHQAHLNYIVGERTVSSQYDLDGQLAVKIEIERPASTPVPVSTAAVNYCGFRGMLYKSTTYCKGKLGFRLFGKNSARLTIGEHPRLAVLKELDIGPRPVLTAFLPQANAVLDDHFECWFLAETALPDIVPEGMESVVNLGQSQQGLPPPGYVSAEEQPAGQKNG
jgi:Acetoacetate decarboxylase (ADC)